MVSGEYVCYVAALSFSRVTTLHIAVRLWDRHNCVRSNTHRKAVEQALQLSRTSYVARVKEVQYAVKNRGEYQKYDQGWIRFFTKREEPAPARA